MKKQLLSLALAVLLMGNAALLSCGDGSHSSDDTSADTTAAEEIETMSLIGQLGTKNFGGKVFTVFESNRYPDLQINISYDEQNGDLIRDALYMRDSTIKDLYNVDIRYEQRTNYDPIVQNAVLAGDDTYQMVISSAVQIASMSSSSILQNLHGLEYTDMEQSWWSPMLSKNMTVNGKQFITIGDIAPSMYQAIMCMFLKTDLAEDYSISVDEIYQLVMDGKWTLSALNGYIRDMNRDLNNDGVMEFPVDFFGLANTSYREISGALLAGSDVQLNNIENGKPVINSFKNQLDVDRVDQILTVAKKYKFSASNDPIAAFEEKKAIFLFHKLESAAAHLRDMEDDYLILPVPKGDENQESYISAISESCHCFLGVPATADSAFTGFMLEAMARYSYENIRPLAYDLVYTKKVVRDERSNDVLQILLDTSYLELMHVYDFGGYSELMRKVVFENAGLASSVASVYDSACAELEAVVESFN